MIRTLFTMGTVVFVAGSVQAQRPDERRGRPDGEFPMPPGFNLMTALDTNRDGKLSTKEIDSAVAALQKLDKNKDGKLSKEEIGWPPPGGFGGGRGGGFPGFGNNGGGRATRPNPDGNPQTQSKSKRPSIFAPGRLKRLDRNNDDKITKDENPKRLQDLVFGRADTNKDGEIDAKELAKFAEPKQ